jgi:3D (Asp-Asp-Asp) domain-containing protein
LLPSHVTITPVSKKSLLAQGGNKMKKAITAIAAAVTFTGMIGGNAFAAEYNVNQGDSLWSIAQENHSTVSHIMEWNHLKSDLILPNQKLSITNKEIYTVIDGDNIWDIAMKYNVTVDQIKKWNDLSTDLIHPDEELVVYPEEDKDVEAKSTIEKPPVKVESSSAKSTSVTVKPVKVASNRVASKKVPSKKVDHVKEIQMRATAYTMNCEKCSGITATGVNLNKNPDAKVISVDPNVIPLGTKVYVEGYGYATAADTGGAIKGTKIDIFIPSLSKAKKWGVRTVTVKILK